VLIVHGSLRRQHAGFSKQPAAPCARQGTLTPQIDSEAPALLIVERKQGDSALDRRRFAHRLDKTKQLHLLGANQANQMGRPPLQVGDLSAAPASARRRAAG
jgi:hypothetical protein